MLTKISIAYAHGSIHAYDYCSSSKVPSFVGEPI